MSQMHTSRELTFDLIDRLHKSLRLSGKTATALAADLGVHRNTVNNYLSGKTPVDRRTLIAWALITDVPLSWLEHGVSAPATPPDDDDGLSPAASQAVAALAARKASRAHGRTTGRYLASTAAA